MSTLTLADIETEFGLTHLDYLDRGAAVPTIEKRGAQGDVLVRRIDGSVATSPVPAEGYPVVRGEVGANTHLLVGEAFYDPNDDGSLVIGRLTVADGATALLSHPEHGGLLIAPGTYEVRRQREQADEIRMVRD